MTQKCHHEQQLDEPMQKKPTRNVTKILLVDDDPDVATTFRAILQDVGFIVDTYEDPLTSNHVFMI